MPVPLCGFGDKVGTALLLWASGWGVDPAVVFFDEVDEAVDGFGFGDIEFHGGLADVEIDFAWGAADVAEVGVGHFAGAVDDAAHDGDADPFEVAGGGADFLGRGLEIEECAAAARAGDVIGFEDADAGGLEDVVGEPEGLAGGGFALDEDGVADAIAEETAEVGGGAEEGVEEGCVRVGGRGERVLEEDGVAFVESGGEEPEAGDDGVGIAVRDGDEDRAVEGVDAGDGVGVERVDFEDA